MGRRRKKEKATPRVKKTVKIGDIIHTEGKVFAIGPCRAITLPKPWMDEHDIKVGDVVVKVGNSILTITPKPKPIVEVV